MSPFYCCLAVVLSLALALASASPAAASISVSAAAERPEPPSNRVSPTEQFLRAHNEARAAVGVPPLSWNATIELDALRYASELRASCEARPLWAWGTDGVYGRNLYKGNGARVRAGADASAYWAEGARWYDRDGAGAGSGSCAAPPGRSCGEYTQMVWRATTQIGCARRLCRCLSDTCPEEMDTVAVCEYYPPGNIVGQRPY
uniref:SCP domain-containing protein n=1 Tax=Oryza punctata TaxID=4537 RepID=A0A0E0KNP6_ORYPU